MLDLSKPVYVKAQILDRKNQSTYPIDMDRPYNAITIPVEFRSELYLTNENGKRKPYLPSEVLPPVTTVPAEAVVIESPTPAVTTSKKVNVTTSTPS